MQQQEQVTDINNNRDEPQDQPQNHAEWKKQAQKTTHCLIPFI